MPGESDLSTLLAAIRPELHPGRWVFATVPPDRAAGDGAGESDAFAVVREEEGTTVVIEKDAADRLGLPYDYVAARITLRVHSSLDAVGLTAAVSGDLALAGLSCNVIAGGHHDHLFVPYDDGPRAVELLEQLGTSPGRSD